MIIHDMVQQSLVKAGLDVNDSDWSWLLRKYATADTVTFNACHRHYFDSFN